MKKIWWLIIILIILALGFLFYILRAGVYLSPSLFSSRQTETIKFAEVPEGGSCETDAECQGFLTLDCCASQPPATGKICVDTTSDENNCGVCGNKCPSGKVCYDPPGIFQSLGCYNPPQVQSSSSYFAEKYQK